MNSVIELSDGDRVLFTDKRKEGADLRQTLVKQLKVDDESVFFVI